MSGMPYDDRPATALRRWFQAGIELVQDERVHNDAKCPAASNCGLVKRLHEEIAKLTDEIRMLRTILEYSYDEVYVTDGQGKTILANSACERHYGLKPEDMIGKYVCDLEAKGVFFPAITPIALRERRRVTIEQETQIGRKMVVTATPVFNENGDIVMVVENSRDITAVEEMKRSFEQVKETSVNAAGRTDSRVKLLEATSEIVAYSEEMKRILETAMKIADADSTVLLQGETGVGKDVVANFIHRVSSRHARPFIKINCAAIPDDLIESELFGYEPGAFTGAKQRGKVGLVKLAEGGTLFLDEIAEMPVRVQAKLLHLLQDKTFIPLGSSNPLTVDVRIIAATNQDLGALLKRKSFREDLFYRLSVMQLVIPPLRERKEDLVPLVYYFLNRFCKKYKKEIDITPLALAHLAAYHWPGNVRELQHTIERCVLLTEGESLDVVHLPAHIKQLEFLDRTKTSKYCKPTLKERVADLERERILEAYSRLKSSYKVAKELGISQSTAIRKIRKYVKQVERTGSPKVKLP